MRKFNCTVCGFAYEPAKGLPEDGIPPGTPFEALPPGFRCPVCGADKSRFSPLALSGGDDSEEPVHLQATVQEVIPRTPRFKSEFDAMQKMSSRFKVVHSLNDAGDEWMGRRGNTDAAMIREEPALLRRDTQRVDLRTTSSQSPRGHHSGSARAFVKPLRPQLKQGRRGATLSRHKPGSQAVGP